MVGNIEKICSRNPGTLLTGLLMRSSCRSCFMPVRGASCYSFSTLLAPSIRVWRCLQPFKQCNVSPLISLKTRSSLIRAGRCGKF